MELHGCADLRSFVDDLHLQEAAKSIFGPRSLEELFFYVERHPYRMMPSGRLSWFGMSFERVLRSCFSIKEGEDLFPQIVLRVKNSVDNAMDYMKYSKEPTDMPKMDRLVFTQFFMLEPWPSEFIHTLKIYFKFKHFIVIKVSNLPSIKCFSTLPLDEWLIVFFDFRGLDSKVLHGIDMRDMTSRTHRLTSNILDVSTFSENQLELIFQKFPKVEGLLIRFTEDLAVFKNVARFPFEAQSLFLSWSEDCDLESHMKALFDEISFSNIVIFDERSERFEKQTFGCERIDTQDSRFRYLSLPNILTDFHGRILRVYVDLKPVLLELASHRFVSENARVRSKQFEVAPPLKSLITYVAYNGLAEDFFTSLQNWESFTEKHWNLFESENDELIESLRIKKRTISELLSGKIVKNVEDYLDFFDDWTMKSHFMDNSFEIVMTTLGFEESYLTINEFLLKLIKSMRSAVLQVLAASTDASIEVDEMTKTIATPYFLWKYSSIDSTESAEAFMSISPFLKLDSVAKINIHDDWLKLPTPINFQSWKVDLLLLDASPRQDKEPADELEIARWFQSKNRNILLFNDCSWIFPEEATDLLNYFSSFSEIKITGVVMDPYNHFLKDFLNNLKKSLISDSLKYLSLRGSFAHEIFDILLELPFLETLALDDCRLLKPFLDAYNPKYLNRSMKVQLDGSRNRSRYWKVDETYKGLINVLSSKSSHNRVSYVHFGADSRFRTFKLASK